MFTLFRLFVSVVALSFPVLAQAGTPPAAPTQSPVGLLPLNSSVDHRVSIDVVVTDKAGNAVPGLAEQDFTLLDDKQARKITSFQATDGTNRTTDPTLQVIFVIDAVTRALRP